jgi:glutamate:GABA antiporter
VLSSLLVIGLYSQSSMANVTIYLQGGLSVVWLLSGFFFFIPLLIARKKYADRYAGEDFWRIPGGMPAVYAVAAVGIVATCAGVYYSFAAPWIKVPTATWMTWVGSIAVGMFVLGAIVYFFGRRSAAKVSKEDALAHLAVLELKEEAK